MVKTENNNMGRGRNPKYKKLSQGYRKYLRREKARIRREVFGAKEQEKQINDLAAKLRS